MARSRWTLLLLGLLAPAVLRAAPPPCVGRAVGLGVQLSGPAGLPPVIAGRRLPVTAVKGGAPGTLTAEHVTALGAETSAVVAATAEWLASDACDLPELRERFAKQGVIVRFDTGGRPMEGGSAGVAVAVAAASVLLDVPVRQDVAMTGEVRADGSVGPVAAVSYKLTAAVALRMSDVLVPYDNANALLAERNANMGLTCVHALRTVREAIREAFGPAGPIRAEYEAYQQRFEHGRARFDAGDFTTAFDDLSWCAAARPGNLSARLWRDRAAFARAEGRRLRRYEQALVLCWQGRWSESAAQAETARDDGAADEAVDGLLAVIRGEQELERCRSVLDEVEQALAAGELERAGELLDQADALEHLPADGRTMRESARGAHQLALAQATARAQPDDPAAWDRLARVAEREEDWETLALAARRVGELQPDRLAGFLEGRALLGQGRRDDAAVRLLEQLLVWPADFDSRGLLSELGIDVTPPSVRASLPADRHLRGEVLVRLNAGDPAASLTVLLDGRAIEPLADQQTWRWDTRAAPDGPHEVTVLAVDPAGNVGFRSWLALIHNDDPPTFGLHGPPPAEAPFAVGVFRPGTWVVRERDAVLLDCARLFEPALRAVELPPSRLAVSAPELDSPAVWADELLAVPARAWTTQIKELHLAGQLDDGRAVDPLAVRLVRQADLAAWLEPLPAGPAGQFELRAVAGLEPIGAWLLLDGVPLRLGPPGRLRVDTAKLPPGRYAVQAVAVTRDGWHYPTPPVLLELTMP